MITLKKKVTGFTAVACIALGLALFYSPASLNPNGLTKLFGNAPLLAANLMTQAHANTCLLITTITGSTFSPCQGIKPAIKVDLAAKISSMVNNNGTGKTGGSTGNSSSDNHHQKPPMNKEEHKQTSPVLNTDACLTIVVNIDPTVCANAKIIGTGVNIIVPDIKESLCADIIVNVDPKLCVKADTKLGSSKIINATVNVNGGALGSDNANVKVNLDTGEKKNLDAKACANVTVEIDPGLCAHVNVKTDKQGNGATNVHVNATPLLDANIKADLKDTDKGGATIVKVDAAPLADVNIKANLNDADKGGATIVKVDAAPLLDAKVKIDLPQEQTGKPLGCGCVGF